MQFAQAVPHKLRSGDWGARVSGSVAVGETITVVTSTGKQWNAVVTTVVWSGDNVTLVKTKREDLPAKSHSKNWDPNAFNGYGRRRGGFRKACKTDGNCSSIGSGRSCGGWDCDGF